MKSEFKSNTYPWYKAEDCVPDSDLGDVIAIDTDGDLHEGYYDPELELWVLESDYIPTDHIAIWTYYPDIKKE